MLEGNLKLSYTATEWVTLWARQSRWADRGEASHFFGPAAWACQWAVALAGSALPAAPVTEQLLMRLGAAVHR
jgi:hypothetical protein